LLQATKARKNCNHEKQTVSEKFQSVSGGLEKMIQQPSPKLQFRQKTSWEGERTTGKVNASLAAWAPGKSPFRVLEVSKSQQTLAPTQLVGKKKKSEKRVQGEIEET